MVYHLYTINKTGAFNSLPPPPPLLKCLLPLCKDAGMHLKHTSEFMLPEMEYLGHWILRHGLQPTEEKVQSIENTPVQENCSYSCD